VLLAELDPLPVVVPDAVRELLPLLEDDCVAVRVLLHCRN